MKLLIRLIFILPLVLLAGLLWAAFSVVQNRPLVDRLAEFTPERIAEGRRILNANDPRKLKAGEVRQMDFSQTDLDLALNYLANQFGRGSANLTLEKDLALVQSTIALPTNPFGSYLNVEAQLSETASLPRIEQLKLGGFVLPGIVANWLVEEALDALKDEHDLDELAEVIKQVKLDPGKLQVTYQWQQDLPSKLGALLIPPTDQERLKTYQAKLAEITQKIPVRNTASLAELTQPLFKLSAERSNQNDPVAENRAALLTLAFYVNRKEFTKLIPTAKDWPKPSPRKIALSGRDDFPKHFIISAALAADAGGRLSDAIGLYKEVDDSRGGSGFSFNDIAADRAGTRLGQLATSNLDSARKLQKFMANTSKESDFMPSVEGLPEFMPEAEFKTRFGGIGAPAYNQKMAEIEKRIAALAFNHRPESTQ